MAKNTCGGEEFLEALQAEIIKKMANSWKTFENCLG